MQVGLCRWGLCVHQRPASHVACSVSSRKPDSLWVCSTVFKWYFAKAGQYWKDLDVIGKDATQYLTNSSIFEEGDSSNMVIFDIDETLLSNITPYGQEGSHDKKLKTGDDYTADDFAPALQAIKDVYLAAYAHGMSVCTPFPLYLFVC